jgi:hypothetical protein
MKMRSINADPLNGSKKIERQQDEYKPQEVDSCLKLLPPEKGMGV